ncbi:GntR family transcriptional regulator [Virgibacillus xinjiangensis]|uniref:GntR family transcriptional regulator n=1 Tax=Virgibacillus xinjiangensis TaxID=393090 RepID=A0ABV7CZX1_9BACI
MKKDQAYKYIKQQIMNGHWHTDSAINVHQIMEELSISRTPVNKALRQLEYEGFLNIIPQVGVFVKRPDEQEVYERLLVCVRLDAYMTGIGASKISEEKIRELEELLEKMDDPGMDSDQYAKLNVDFHSAIIYSSGLDYMIKMTKQLWDYLNYVTTPTDLFMEEVRRRSQTEHWMILQTLKDRDVEMATRIMEKHMGRVAEFVKGALENLHTT